jgi:hypothetical protein
MLRINRADINGKENVSYAKIFLQITQTITLEHGGIDCHVVTGKVKTSATNTRTS